MQEPAVNAEIVLHLVPQQMAGDGVICSRNINKTHKQWGSWKSALFNQCAQDNHLVGRSVALAEAGLATRSKLVDLTPGRQLCVEDGCA